MVELMLPTTGPPLDIPVILDVVDLKIPPLLGLHVLDGNKLLVDNIANHIGTAQLPTGIRSDLKKYGISNS